MRIPRIYQNQKLTVGENCTLDKDAVGHLIRVLRFAINDEIILFNGEDGEYKAVITAIRKQEVTVAIKEFIQKHVESPLHIHLGQAISRGEKMDYTIQKAVELGVTQITPLITDRCGVKLTQERWEKRLQHWRAVAIAACEQSGRNSIPDIQQPQQLTDWLNIIPSTHYKIILHPEENSSALKIDQKPNAITLLVGPEGGFSADEVALAKTHNFQHLILGPRILRTETAALAAISVLQAMWGDFKI